MSANSQLAALMEESGVSRKGLAQRVRTLSQQQGDDPPANPDHNRVRRWVVNGEVPKLITQRYVAQALSAKLGRSVSLEDLGFPASESEQSDLLREGARYPEQVSTSINVLSGLAGADQQGQELGPAWSPDTTPSVITSYLFTQQLAVVSDPSPGEKRGIAAPIRDTTASFMQLDLQYGGGHLRSLLLSFFRETVIPKMREHHPDEERRDLFSAAAEVAQLLGWTSYDAGYHAAARMYFIQGLRIAREADDRMMGGRLLSNLSHQANYLGQYSDALQYARAAQHAVFGVATPTVNVLLFAMEARALANQGESRAVADVMGRAETGLDRGAVGSEPGWVSYVDASELAGEWAHCFRDLGQTSKARSFAEQALQSVPARTQAFMRMVGATSTLKDGNLDDAVVMARQAVDLAGPLDSARFHGYLTDFHGRLLAQHKNDPRTREFEETITGRYPQIKLPNE